MRIPTTARVGIAAILAAIILFLGTARWVETRTYVAVDIPVTLSRGHIRTGDFKINLRALYSILIVTDDYSFGCYEDSALQTRRISSVSGHAITGLGHDAVPHGEDVTMGPFLGTFESEPGRYSLDIEVLSDASCLDPLHPRLYISASPTDYAKWRNRYELGCLVSLVAGAIGIVLLSIASVRHFRRASASDALISILEPRGHDCRPARQKITSISAAFPVFSQVGLLYAQILLLLVIPSVLVFMHSWGYDRHSVGLFVLTYFPQSSLFRHNSCTEEWVVRVDSEDDWYLNSKRVKQDELPKLLRQQIGQRTSCIVFLDANPDVPYALAVHAIDLIGETPGRVVLLTPGIKKIHIP
jgi:biopolymer transport protein ExbD